MCHSASIFSQIGLNSTSRLDGIVLDSLDNKFLNGAVIILKPKRSLDQYHILSDSTGSFTFKNISKGEYQIEVHYIGYEPFSREINIPFKGGKAYKVYLADKSKTLTEVVVVSKPNVIAIKGDTLLFYAKNYAVNPDATSQDLLEKIPGISSEGGTLRAQSEIVRKVIVDGKEYSSENKNLALNNIPAYVVDKIQIFDYSSDLNSFLGFDDGTGGKTINIITKKDNQNGLFGKIFGGAGYISDFRYKAGLSLNLFQNDRRITLIENSTNSQFNQPSSTSNDNSYSINYSDLLGKRRRLKISINYDGNIAKDNSSLILERTFLGSEELYNETSFLTKKSNKHNLFLRLEYAIDSLNSLTIIPQVSFNFEQSNTGVFGKEYDHALSDSSSLINVNNIETGRETKLQNEILYLHKFAGSRRSLTLNFQTIVFHKLQNINSGNSSIFQSGNAFDTISKYSQEQQSLYNNYFFNLDLSYVEPLSKFSRLLFGYTPLLTLTQSNIFTADSHYPINTFLFDSALSNSFISERNDQNIRINYGFRNKFLNISIGCAIQYCRVDGSIHFPSTMNISRQYFNILASTVLNYKFSNSSVLKFSYQPLALQPTIMDLQQKIDNRNPLFLNIGNPALKQAFTHILNVRYSSIKAATGSSFISSATLSISKNGFSNSLYHIREDTLLNDNILLLSGSSFFKPVNINFSMDINQSISYGFHLKLIKCNLNFMESFKYSMQPNIVDGRQNRINNYNFSLGSSLTSNISPKIDFAFSYQGKMLFTDDKSQARGINKYYTHVLSVRVNWNIWHGLILRSNAENNASMGNMSFGQVNLMWNLSFSYQLLKNRSLDINLGLFDILNQRTTLSHLINASFVEDRQTQTLSRYLLLTLTYSPRFFKNIH